MKKIKEGMPASLFKRGLAYLIDIILISFVVVIPMQSAFPSMKMNEWSLSELTEAMERDINGQTITVALVIGLFFIAYWSILEYLLQQSVGKMVMHLRVVSTNKKKLTLWQCIVRNITKGSSTLLFLDILYMFKSGRKRFFESLSQTEVIVGGRP